MSPKIRSDCFFAHVRAASTGGITEYNCHPFCYQQLLFMHNGSIHGFSKIKRYLRKILSDNIYEWIKGQTDSEHFFALFLEIFQKNNCRYNVADIADSLREAIKVLEDLKQKHGADGPTYLNELSKYIKFFALTKEIDFFDEDVCDNIQNAIDSREVVLDDLLRKDHLFL